MNALVDDHWGGRSIEDIAEECSRILRDPARMTRQVTERFIQDLLELDAGASECSVTNRGGTVAR